MPDKIKEVFELISDKGYFSNENEFRSYVSDPKRRAEAFELIKDDGFFTDENEFNSYFEDVKKKDFQGFSQELPKPTMPSGEKFTQGIGLGVKPISSTVSPSASKPPKSTIPSASIGVKESEIGFKPDLTIPWDKAPAGSEIIKADKNADYLRVKTAKSPENKPFVDFKTERVFESLPSVTKSVINKDNELKLDFLNFVKDNPESAAKLQAWQGDNTATGQGVKYEVLQGFYNNVLGKYVPHLEELDKAGVGSQLQKAQSFYGDFNKSIDDLKKAQVKLQFYQNNFIESKGYGDIVAQGKQLNNKLKDFNIDAWQADTERLLADIEIKKAETEKYIVDGSVPREYQDEYVQAYGQYESAVNIYNEHNNIPELQDYNNSIQSLKNLDAESATLLREFEGNSDYKKAKEDYEVALQRFESMKPQAEEFKQQQPLFNDYIQTAKKVSNLVDKIELSNKAFPAIISREETRERVTNLYNNGYMNESTLRNFAGIAESIPKAVNSIGAGIGSTLSALTFGQAGEYNVYDKMADYYDGLNKYNSTVLPTMKSYKELKDGSTKWDFAAIGFQGFQQIGNMAIFATLGRYGKAPMVVTGYMMSRKDRENEAKEAGLTGLSKEAYVSTLSSLEGLSELVMPDSQIFTKEIKQMLLKDAVLAQTKGINWFRKQAFKRIAENTGKEVTEEFIVKIGELMQKVSSNYSNGNIFDVSSYKDVNSWIETAAITAPLTILASSASEIKTPKIELEQARFQAAKNLTKSREVLDDLVSTGNMTTQKADDEYKKIVNYAAIQSVMPVDISPAKAVEVAPLIIENKKLEIVKESGIDEVFKKQINEKIKENIAKAEEILSRPEEPTPKGDTELEVTEPVIEEGKEQVEIEETPIKEQETIAEASDSKGVYLKDGEYGVLRTDGQTVVFETNDKIFDLGNKDELSDVSIAEFGIEKEEPLNIQVNQDNSIVIDDVRFVNNFSEPQAAINTDADGNVISVNLETEDGKKRTFRGQRAEEIAYQYKLKEFEQNATEESIARLEQEVTSIEGKAEKAKSETKKRSAAKRKSETIKTKEDAVQKQTAGQVPVQPETEVSEGVEGGKPKAEPKEVTEESKVEEIGTGLLNFLGIPSEVESKDTGVNVSNKSALSELEGKVKGDKKSIIEAAKKAIATLKSVFPDMEIYIHETPESYNKVMRDEVGGVENSRGNFAFERDANNNPTGRGRIDINLSNAKDTTVAHELTHAVLLKTFGDNPALFKTFRNRISNILRADLNEQVTAFEKLYAGQDVAPEEYLTELAALLSQGGEKVKYKPSTLRRIASLINEFVSRITKGKLQPFKSEADFKNFVDFLNQVAGAISEGGVIDDTDTLNGGGEVGTFNFTSKGQLKAPKASEDSRDFIRKLVEDVDIREFNGKKFVTNMYDYTTAGVADLGNGFEINMLGGKNYVPYMMSKKNKAIGEVSNLAAFNTKGQAESFVRNAKKGKAELFAPHSGTLSASWQFQQHTFAELVNLILDKGIMNNAELINTFNKTIESSQANQKAFAAFKNKYKENIKNFNSFKSDPKQIVKLLDIENNYSPDLRKALNNAISADKTFQKAIGIKNKEEFFNKIIDPLNKGVTGGELINVVKFDPNTFEIVQTKPDAVDHHPSFGWTLLAKIDGIYQPTEFHKSSEVTNSYTKYNKDGASVSRKATEPSYEKTNVSSSAGAIPKIAKLEVEKAGTLKSKAQKVQDEKIKEYIDSQRKAGQTDKNIRAGIEMVADRLGLSALDIDNLMNAEKIENSKKAFEFWLNLGANNNKFVVSAKMKSEAAKAGVDEKALKNAAKTMKNIDEIRKKLLDAKVIETIDCKWG